MTTPPAYGNPAARSGRSGPGRSGTARGGTDPTSEPDQYPPENYADAIFGGPLPDGTGAPGTAGGRPGADTTTEAGQLSDSFAGLPDSDIDSTGAPGTAGVRPRGGGGPDAVSYTEEGSFDDGYWSQGNVRGNIGGPQDWTQANSGGYGTPGPKLPAMTEPTPDAGPFQPRSGGRVMRGGRAVSP
jgi:hypothetical protein